MPNSPTNKPNEEPTQAKKRGRPKKQTPTNKPNEETPQRAFFAPNDQPSQRPTNSNVNENAPKSNANENENEQAKQPSQAPKSKSKAQQKSKKPSQAPNEKKRGFSALDDEDNENEESKKQDETERKKQKLSAKKEEILKTKRVFKNWEGIFNSAQKGCKGMTNFRDSCLLRLDQVEGELKDYKVKDDNYKFNKAVEKAGLPSVFYFTYIVMFLLHFCCIFVIFLAFRKYCTALCS